MLGLNDRTITLTADDEYLQIMLEKKIDNYLKKLDEDKYAFIPILRAGTGMLDGLIKVMEGITDLKEVFKDVELVAVCDLIRERAEKAQA